MVYKIIIQDKATADAREYAAFIQIESKASAPAIRWLEGLQDIIRSLSKMPNRYKLIREQEFKIPLRQVTYHSHRVIYYVNEPTQTVHILRIYHGSRKPLSAQDVSSWQA